MSMNKLMRTAKRGNGFMRAARLKKTHAMAVVSEKKEEQAEASANLIAYCAREERMP